MSKERLEKLKEQIKDMREELYQTINDKGTLSNDEVIIASKMLDALLNEYDILIKKLGKE